ncbi:acyl-CoA N-acyltransferase [Kickxella alabastrina]|uniref:acyl-CoA N-acyltransferase n=1 Tax=Kickxella alabastrina TaxID=61397 RepID=UPI00221F90DA|nr:acyl-CoA N-acyltransferase [Kickxella alabastrina]KAI7830788.1 acyl-CoA N-acyltransferase [Kickxella alabastrina]
MDNNNNDIGTDSSSHVGSLINSDSVLSGLDQQVLREWISKWTFHNHEFSALAQPLIRGCPHLRLSTLSYQDMRETPLQMPAMEVVIAGAQYYKKAHHHHHHSEKNHVADYAECLRLLSMWGVDVDQVDVGGFTAFMRAAQGEAGLELAAVLLDLGANVDHRSRFGGVALHEALMARDRRAVAFLRRQGGSLDICDYDGVSPRDIPESGSEPECDSESEDAGADVIQFHPAFTYAIYGEHERVFGYKNLRINLCYASGSLATFLWADHGRCITDMETSMAVSLKADDVITPLRAVLSENALCGSKEEFAAQVARDTAGFRPFGRKVWEGDLRDDAFREYHRRLQTLCLLYIEGAQFIDDAMSGGGYSWRLSGRWSMQKRPRISQFLVLPPFQAQGHGSELYRFVHACVRASPEYVELAVEDPSEAFDDMRDRNDMRFLLDQGAQMDWTVPRTRVQPQADDAVLEIGALKRLDKTDAEAYRRFRLFVKRRIYAQNTDAMAGMDAEERKKRVNDSFESVVEDYHRILSLL